MIPSDQFSIADKEYLHYRILLPQIFAVIHCHCNDVPVFQSVAGNFLTLTNSFDALNQITKTCRIFKTHFL